jgi:adenylate cyclase
MSEAVDGLRVDERRLAAILAADVAGYSRLMGRNEEATVRDLEAHKAAILPIIARHGGSIINIAGDGIVVQFPSAVRAVECAVAIQKIMGERNVDVPKERQMLLRIGVNLGDIIHDADKTYGDGINVAARLEPLAEPGGICISANVRDAIFGKLGLPLRDIGEKSLKNIDRPVHVYQIRPPHSRARRDWLGAAFRQYRRLAPSLGLVVLLAALAGGAAWRFWPREMSSPDYTPVIAVLPFANTSGDKSLDTLGPSLAREVSAMLATYPLFRMVPPSGLPSKADEDIGRRYALDGDLLKSGDKLRVRPRLTDATSGQTIWSDSYEFDDEDTLAVQKKTAERIYGAVADGDGRLFTVEREAAWRKPESALSVWDYALRSWSRMDLFSGLAQARQIAKEGLARSPDSALLKIVLAWSYQSENNFFGPFENCRDTTEIAYKFGREADETKNKSPYEMFRTHDLMSHLEAYHGENFGSSVWHAEAAVEMSPNNVLLRANLISRLAQAGQMDKAMDWISWAMAHDYKNHSELKINAAWTYYLAGRYEEALRALKGVEASNPWPITMIYANLGRMDEAKAAAAEWLKDGLHSIRSESCVPIREPMKQKYLDDLRKVGVPERAKRASP